jgi:hypothetical protein
MPTLAVSNKHISTLAKRRKAMKRMVATSSAIEGIRVALKSSKPSPKRGPVR